MSRQVDANKGDVIFFSQEPVVRYRSRKTLNYRKCENVVLWFVVRIVICSVFVTFWNQISSLKFFGKIIPTSISVVRGGGWEFSLSTVFEVTKRHLLSVLKWLYFSFPGLETCFSILRLKISRNWERVYKGGSTNLNCMYPSKRREIWWAWLVWLDINVT
jgi:hypothetical protein